MSQEIKSGQNSVGETNCARRNGPCRTAFASHFLSGAAYIVWGSKMQVKGPEKRKEKFRIHDGPLYYTYSWWQREV